jgi:CRP-like cAMP-binding protein
LVLIKGKVSINKNEVPNSELNFLEPGAVFGEKLLITGEPRSTNAMEKTYVFTLKLEGQLFHELDPAILNKFKDHLLKLLIRRLNEMNASFSRIKRDFKDQKDSFNKVKDEIDKVIVASQNIKENKEMFSGFLDDIRG